MTDHLFSARAPRAGAHPAGRAVPRFWACAPALLLVLLPLVRFWQVWWPGSSARLAFAYGDFQRMHYPMRAFVASTFRSGHLPLWSPYTYSGEPAIAQSIYSAFYPVGLWQAIFPAPFPFTALEVEALFHLGLAGAFTFLFVRALTGSKGAGLIAGLAFGLGGLLTSYPILQLYILETATWLPAALWLLETGLARRQLARLALAGAALGAALLAGHFQTFLYIAYLAGAYALLRARMLRVPWRFALKGLLALGSLALTLGLVQLLPSLEIAGLSPRATLSYQEVSGGFTPGELWGIIRPNPGQWSPLYSGLIPLGLALLALPFARRGERWFWVVAGALALALSLGHNGFFYPIFHAVVPGFAVFRNQERAALVVSLAVAVLAGYGYAALRTRWGRFPRLAWAVPLLLATVTVVDLWRANGAAALFPAPSAGYFPADPIAAHVRNTGTADWRASTEALLPGEGNGGLVYGVRDITGDGPLHLAHYDRFLATLPEQRLWQLLNVQHLITRRALDHGALAPVMQDGDRRLYQVFVKAQPAWIVHAMQLAGDVDDAIERTADPALDPMATAVLEGSPVPAPLPASGAETARLARFEPARVTVDATLTAPGLLVSSEVAYPGWVATANGSPVPIYRAYGLLRAVALPAGTWRVDWRYRPWYFLPSLALWGAGLVLTALLAWSAWRTREVDEIPPPSGGYS